MNPQATRQLLRRLAERAATNTIDSADGMMVEDVADFLSAERFARERRQFFQQTPQVVGFAGEVSQPGSYHTVEVMGMPVVITRDASGTLHAFINACAHRGAKVAHGSGCKGKLVCQFHGWNYALDGQLYGRPQDKCFSPADNHANLTRLPVSDRSGLLVVGPDPAMPQSVVDNHLAAIEGEFTGFGFRDMHSLETRRFEVKANWKLIAALSYESYHFATLHRDSVAQWLLHNYVCDFFDNRHSRWSFPLKGIEKLLNKPESEWPAAVPGAVSHALFPGTVVITNPEDAQIIRTEPGQTPDTSVVYYTGVCRNAERKTEALAAYDFGGKAFEHEDLPAAIECQLGLNTRLALEGNTRIHIGSNEPVVQFWHKVWKERLLN